MNNINTVYSGKMHEYFTLLKDEQGLDRELWKILVRQFRMETDKFDYGWRGEFWGKLMRGMSLIFAYTLDEELYSVLEETVKELLSCEKAGRISTYAEEKELIGWDVWARKYVLLGLEFFYDVCKEGELKQEVFNALKRIADYLVARIGTGENQKSIEETSYSWGAANSCSLLQPIIRLYKLTGEERYLKFSEYLIKHQKIGGENLFKIMAEKPIVPNDFAIKKAYEVISCFEGLLDYYDVTKNQGALIVCRNFADAIVDTELTIVGGCGLNSEYFNSSKKEQVIKTDVEKQETCVTVTVMKFLSEMYLKTREQKYIDVVEKMFFNAYLGALNDSKNKGHLARPAFYSYSPVYDNPRWTLMGGNRNVTPYACYGCCVAIGAAGLGLIPSVGVVADTDTIKINFYLDGKYKTGDAEFIITSNYPYDCCSTITFTKTEQTKKVQLRIPCWAKDFKVSGATIIETNEEFILLDGVTTNTKIECMGKTPLIVHRSVDFNQEVQNLIAIQKGAIVYAIDSLETDLSVQNEISLDKVDVEIADGRGILKTDDNKEISLIEYKDCGKDYYKVRDISVWIKTKNLI